jgi:glycosyltransferase involved in cell wall biosynthesis
MACGCAVVASNVGGVPEMVDHGRNGLLFPAGDTGDLERQLATLIENPALRRQMAAAAAEDAKARFGMEIIARRMEAFYDSLL